MTGTVHELHHIVWYDGFSPWSIPGSHVGSPLSLEPELLADHLGIPPLNHQEFFSNQSDGKRGGGGGGAQRAYQKI